MKLTCATCGGSFEAKRSTAKFCSSNCRVRSHRGGGQVVELKPPAKKGHRESPPPADELDGPGEMERAIVAELEEAGRRETGLGTAAVLLARRLDARTMDTGSAVAAVVRQLQTTMEAAVAGAHMAADPVDEVRRRRDEKLGKLGIVG